MPIRVPRSIPGILAIHPEERGLTTGPAHVPWFRPSRPRKRGSAPRFALSLNAGVMEYANNRLK